MSDSSNNSETDSSEQDSPLSNRLASLRASIRASKERQKEVDEEAPPQSPDEDEEEGSTSVDTPPMAMSAVDWSGEEDEPGAGFSTSSAEFDAVEPEGEEREEEDYDAAATVVDDEPLATVTDEDEPLPTVVDESGASLAAALDEASEAAEEAAAAAPDVEEEYPVDPTVVQPIDEFADAQGTPLYMSPEQCRNDAQLEPATDVYALGVMLFELLEGHPPYSGETVDEVLVKHQDAAIPEQMSEFTPDPVRDLIARMMAKDPAQRPTTAEVIEVLQREVQIGGPDVHGLEEESWTVDEIIEDDEPGGLESEELSEAEEVDRLMEGAPAPDDAPAQFLHPAATDDEEEPSVATIEPRNGPRLSPVAIGALLVVPLLIIGLGFALMGSDSEDPVAPPQEQASEQENAPEPSPEPAEPEPVEEQPAIAAAQTNGAEEVPDISGQIDAARRNLGDGLASAATASNEAAEELEKREKRRKRRKRRRKRKKKKKLREIRLDL